MLRYALITHKAQLLLVSKWAGSELMRVCESVRWPSSVFYKALLGKRHVGNGEEQTGMSLILPSLCTRNVVLVWVTPVIIVAHRQRNKSQCFTKIMKKWGLSTHADLFNSYPLVVLSSREVDLIRLRWSQRKPVWISSALNAVKR